MFDISRRVVMSAFVLLASAVVAAEAIELAGGDPFMEYTVPQAVIRFKQGFGRLIRVVSYGCVERGSRWESDACCSTCAIASR